MFERKGSFVLLWIVLLASLLGRNALLAQGLGKFSEWSEPVSLGPVINLKGYIHGNPILSPNGLSLYFISNRPGTLGGFDIFVSQRASLEDPWEEPQNLGPNINTTFNEFTPYFSPDGHWLYFSSYREGSCGGKDQDMWRSYREDTEDDFGWDPAENLGCVINSIWDDGGMAYFEDMDTGIVTLYFTSNRPEGLGGFDMYASTLRRDGSFGPGVLVPELNSPQDEIRPYIRPDGLEMFLRSNREGGYGDDDIWVSTRETTRDAWSTPVNLGPPINTEYNDGAATLSPDGTTLYFNSNRPGGYAVQDIYMATRKKLDE